MERIKDEVIKLLDDKLMEYIIEDTRDLIANFERQVLKEDFDVFAKFPAFMERIQNIVELSFRYIKAPEKTIPCDVAWLLLDLASLKDTINNCNYKFQECNFMDEPLIVEELGQFIVDTASGCLIDRDNYFTVEDIEAYKNKRTFEDEANKLRIKENEEAQQRYIDEKKEIVENWRKDNLNADFDFSVLSEEEIDILKVALNSELKSISLSWLQRKFAMSYRKATAVLEKFERYGAVSTVEDIEKLGLNKSGRIIRVTL